MYGLQLVSRGMSLDSVLVIGAHSDDIEIGAGGFVRWLLQTAPGIQIRWVVLAAAGERDFEARRSASSILGTDQRHRVETFEFRDGFFPYRGEELKETFETFKIGQMPSLILTHHRQDLHQDHRVVAELTWNTFRDHFILEYEIPKYDGGLGSPNVFVPLSKQVVEQKIEGLITHFGTQRSKRWFTEETFRGLMRLRGIECQSPSGYAEAFYARKIVLASTNHNND